MKKIDDGGPAFPRPFSARHEDAIYWPQSGMSLRDWFAGQALAGWLASFPPDAAVKPIKVAAFAYEVADAMLAARRALEGGENG